MPKLPHTRSWADYQAPNRDPFRWRTALGFILLTVALTIGFALMIGGMQ